MLEKETDLILQLLAERTIGPRDSIALKEVLGSTIPKNIKKYIQCEVVRWLSSDLRSTPSFSHIPTKAKTTSAVMESMLQSLAPEYVFSQREFLNTLENGVHFLENYLCRPRWTLEHFIFEKEERVPVDSMLSNLEYFTDYSYLRDLIERASRIKGWFEIERGAFRSLVARIDAQVVMKHSAHEMAMLTRPIYDFLCLEEAPFDRAIPLKPLLVFFDDKEMKVLKEHVEEMAKTKGRSELSLAELAEIIDTLFIGDAPPVQEEVPLETARAVTPEPAGQFNDSPTESNEEKTTSPPEPHDEVENDPDATKITTDRQAPPENPRAVRNPTLSLTFAGLTETQQTQPLPRQTDGGLARQTRSTESIGQADGLPDARLNADGGQGQVGGLANLSNLIAQEQKERFIEKMFKKDDAYYAGIMTALNRTLTWKEASLYLNELYQTNGLDPFADEVVEFTDAIHSRYTIPDKHPE